VQEKPQKPCTWRQIIYRRLTVYMVWFCAQYRCNAATSY